MHTILLIAIIAVFSLTGCKKETTVQPKGVQLRIENLTAHNFDSVAVVNPAGNKMYYSVTAGAKTDYKDFTFIYNYAYIKVYYNNKIAIMQPVDYVGETRIVNGKYTYRLSIVTNAFSNYISVQNQQD